MIIVTNGTEVIKINKKYLLKTNEGYYIKPEFDYWMINLIVILENGIISKIIKILPKGDEILDEFNNITEPMYEKMFKNNDENEVLTQIRDTLLPKLMKGEINLKK